MDAVLTDQVLFRISFGVAAFIFELVLFILLIVLGHGQRDNNKQYRTLVVLVLCGIAASIMDNIFRVSDIFDSPPLFKVFLQLAVLVLNVLLTYYVLRYLETFVRNDAHPGWRRANRIIVAASVVFAVVLFAQAVHQYLGGADELAVPVVGRIIIGYAVEVYFLVFSLVHVIRYRHSFERRALYTALGAYAAIIATIVLQLLETRGLLLNYFGAVIGSYIFYIGVEIPDHRNLKKSLDVVQTLAEAIDAKDTYTHGHSGRVAAYSREIARRAGYSESDQHEIYMMGLLHDVGKIGVSDAVINKPGRLDDDEFQEIKQHPVIGAKILGGIKDMPSLLTGAKWHHERVDGRGYPDGLVGGEIPREARIIAVADAYDAMTSNRSYRDVMPQERVRAQIENGLGTQFDPEYGRIMLEMIDEDADYLMRERD